MELVIETARTAEIAEQLSRELVHEAVQEIEKPCSAEGSLWVVVCDAGVDMHEAPSWMVRPHGRAEYLKIVRCLVREGAWMHISDADQQPLGWVMWKKGKGKAWHLQMKPIALIEVESRWVNEEGALPVRMPGDALDWSLAEVEVFLGSMGAHRPSRQTAICRSRKQQTRAVRFGPVPLEYRVGVSAEGTQVGGVFALAEVKAGRLVERCPLLRVTEAATRLSAVLGRLAIRLPPEGDKERFALVLGFGRLYDKHSGANCRWGFSTASDDDIVIYAHRDIFVGDELFLELDGPPLTPPPLALLEAGQSLEEELMLNHKALMPSGKLAASGGLVHFTSPAHGRGVFARQDYEPGDLIESCAAVELDEVGAKALVSYRWGIPGKEGFFVPMGLGALYNHFEPPHARGKLDMARSVLEVHAEAPIRKGQEVFVSYGDTYFDDDFAALGHSRIGYRAPEVPAVSE